MAIWTIPEDMIINYVNNGDDLNAFTRKTKYCLENAYECLRELHAGGISSISDDGTSICGISVALENLEDGQILSYDAAANVFKNVAKPSSSASVIVNLNEIINQLEIFQETSHLARLVENLYLTLDVADFNPGGYDGLSGETFYGGAKDVDAARSTVTIEEGKIYGDDKIFVSKPLFFENKISRAHLIVKHQNVADAEIKAEIAIRDAIFVKDEVLAIGDGTPQTVTLANTANLNNSIALYFDGELQTNFSFNSSSGKVTFTAPSGVIVTANYFYNFGAENFVTMTKTGTYPDRRNQNRATTQFTYAGTAGTVATLRLTLKQGAGESEINSIGTGKPQGFKLAHQAISGNISVTPTNIAWQYNAAQNAVIVTAPVNTAIKISYKWKGENFSVDSFAVMFDE